MLLGCRKMDPFCEGGWRTVRARGGSTCSKHDAEAGYDAPVELTCEDIGHEEKYNHARCLETDTPRMLFCKMHCGY